MHCLVPSIPSTSLLCESTVDGPIRPFTEVVLKQARGNSRLSPYLLMKWSTHSVLKSNDPQASHVMPCPSPWPPVISDLQLSSDL
jgi:hypothetical protein